MRCVGAAVLALFVWPAGLSAAADAPAEPTVAELLQRIEALEKALAEVRRDAEGCATSRNTGTPETVAPADRAPVARRKDAAADSEQAEAAAKKVATAAPVTAGYDKKGFFLGSADGANRLRIGGLLQPDSRWFVSEDRGSDVNQFFLRRARLDIRARIAKRFGFRLTPDFSGSDLSLKDAYIDVDFADWLELRSGKFKTPFGIERLASSSDLVFIERSLVDNLVPVRDVGAQLGGKLAGGAVEYAFAVGNGTPDGGSVDTDVNDAVDLAARVFAQPFVTNMYSPVRGLGFGLAATWGCEQGTTSSTQLSSYRTASGRSRFFQYVNDDSDAGTAIADGDHWRISPQASWYEGRVGLLTEYVRTSQQVGLDGTQGWVDNGAWQVRGSWVLTGERTSEERPEPSAPFDFGGGHWGAWELAARWASLDVDGDAFDDGFADPDASARHADAFAAAINWYLNSNVSFYLDYEHTMFGGGAAGGDRADEDVLLTRLQLAF